MVQICLMPLVLREVWGTLGEPRLPQLCAEGHRGGGGDTPTPGRGAPHSPRPGQRRTVVRGSVVLKQSAPISGCTLRW